MTAPPTKASPLLLLACLIGGGAMLWFGVHKLLDPVTFLKAMREYQIVPTSWPWALTFLAVWIPAIEILGGLLLILGLWRRPVAAVLSLMLIGFTAMVLLRALGIHDEQGGSFCEVCFDCGCGTGVVCICTKLAENAAMLICCLYAAFSRRRRPCSLGA